GQRASLDGRIPRCTPCPPLPGRLDKRRRSPRAGRRRDLAPPPKPWLLAPAPRGATCNRGIPCNTMPPPPRTRLWRKRLTRAILCLLLGAVTTVGVAWGTTAAATPVTRNWVITWRAMAIGGGQQWSVSYKRSTGCTGVYIAFEALPPSTRVGSLEYGRP